MKAYSRTLEAHGGISAALEASLDSPHTLDINLLNASIDALNIKSDALPKAVAAVLSILQSRAKLIGRNAEIRWPPEMKTYPYWVCKMPRWLTLLKLSKPLTPVDAKPNGKGKYISIAWDDFFGSYYPTFTAEGHRLLISYYREKNQSNTHLAREKSLSAFFRSFGINLEAVEGNIPGRRTTFIIDNDSHATAVSVFTGSDRLRKVIIADSLGLTENSQVRLKNLALYATQSDAFIYYLPEAGQAGQGCRTFANIFGNEISRKNGEGEYILRDSEIFSNTLAETRSNPDARVFQVRLPPQLIKWAQRSKFVEANQADLSKIVHYRKNKKGPLTPESLESFYRRYTKKLVRRPAIKNYLHQKSMRAILSMAASDYFERICCASETQIPSDFLVAFSESAKVQISDNQGFPQIDDLKQLAKAVASLDDWLAAEGVMAAWHPDLLLKTLQQISIDDAPPDAAYTIIHRALENISCLMPRPLGKVFFLAAKHCDESALNTISHRLWQMPPSERGHVFSVPDRRGRNVLAIALDSANKSFAEGERNIGWSTIELLLDIAFSSLSSDHLVEFLRQGVEKQPLNRDSRRHLADLLQRMNSRTQQALLASLGHRFPPPPLAPEVDLEYDSGISIESHRAIACRSESDVRKVFSDVLRLQRSDLTIFWSYKVLAKTPLESALESGVLEIAEEALLCLLACHMTVSEKLLTLEIYTESASMTWGISDIASQAERMLLEQAASQ